MRQIIGTASNHYDMIDASGEHYPCVELVLISMEVDYEAGAAGMRKIENHKTERYHLRIDQLKNVIEQLKEIAEHAIDLREET